MTLKIYDTKSHNNFGDILTPWIIETVLGNKVELVSTVEESNLFGIGSILHMCPTLYQGSIWSSGFIYPTHRLILDKPPLAVRGKLSLNQIIGTDTSTTVLGDGGLILDRIYCPTLECKYKLGVMPHYIDYPYISQSRIFQTESVVLINPLSGIENVLHLLLQCENVVTSSLHGIVSCDSYGIPHAVFKTIHSDRHIYTNQARFKLRDYYSVFDIDFTDADFVMTTHTTVDECLSYCKPVNKPSIEQIKDGLMQTLTTLNEAP